MFKLPFNTSARGQTNIDVSEYSSCLLPDEVLLLSVYSGLQLLSPLATVDEILADEFEESFGEVVKFLDGVVLDLVRRSMFQKKHFSSHFKQCKSECTVQHLFYWMKRQQLQGIGLLGMGGLSGPRAIFILALNHKHLWEHKLSKSHAGTTDLHMQLHTRLEINTVCVPVNFGSCLHYYNKVIVWTGTWMYSYSIIVNNSSY